MSTLEDFQRRYSIGNVSERSFSLSPTNLHLESKKNQNLPLISSENLPKVFKTQQKQKYQ
jgi:hypothetical protein